jgi:hypothetical protein
MRTYLYRPAAFLTLLVVCLMFAPARLVTGDRQVYPYPVAAPAVLVPSPEKSFADLCREDAVAAVARSLDRYRTDIDAYTCTLVKQERINGKLKDREVIRCEFRESPFAVRMEWREGQGRAAIMLYPAGDRADRLAVVPSNALARKVLPYVIRSLDERDVRAAARYPANEFGLYHGTARVHLAFKAAQERGLLYTRYEGLQPVPELGGKSCHVLHRDCAEPEEDGQTAITLYFDPDNLQQVGSVLQAGDQLLATYYFRDLVLNPPLPADHFVVERLR